MSDQHLLPNESFSEYKTRVLDTKSSSFCGAKWYYATVWLNTGQTTSCHHPLPHQVDPIAVLSNPKLLSNTPRKKRERAEMQKGIQCRGCDYCWRVENLDKGKISDRVYKSVLYSDELLQKAYESDSEEDFDLKYLELSFDRTCNFACNYCNPAFSTMWAKDIKNNGAYENIGDDGKNHYGHSHAEASRYNEDNNPFVEAFFKWWESDLKRTLTHLRLTGGEPLMSKHTWKLLDLMAEGDSNVGYFAINSNLNAKQDLIDKLLAYAGRIKGLNVYTSNESVGTKAEYLRDGLDFNVWQNNFHKLYDSGKFDSMHSMCTIGALSLEGITEYLDWCLNFKKQKDNMDAVTFTLNIQRFPNFQSPLVLPMSLRQRFAGDLNAWLYGAKKTGLLHKMEIEHVDRLIEYVSNENNSTDKVDVLTKYFKNYYRQYDKRRGKDLQSTFPIIGKWYDGI